MSVLVSLETSTTVCSVAIHDGGKLLASSELHVPQSAASKLAVMVEDVLKISGIGRERIEGVAVSAGPGSYTGLRIGVATAKGMCYALGVPLISVNTLELMVRQVIDSGITGSLLCPMLDARRMEVYCLVADGAGKMVVPTEAKVIDELSFKELLDREVVTFFGDGAAKCESVLRHANARFIHGVYPMASKLGGEAFRKFGSKQFEDLSAYEPFYLKDFVIKKPKAT